MPIPIKNSISGSSAATILGLNKWATPFEAWQKIMEQLEPGFNSLHGYVLPEFEENAAIRFGNAFESANIAITEEKLGVVIEEQERVFTGNVGSTALSCHVDGVIHKDLTEDGNTFNRDVLYEGKTTSIMAYRAEWKEETQQIPVNYMMQIQHNMYLSGCTEAVVSVLVFPETPEKWEEMGIVPEYHESGDMYDLNVNDGENWYHPKKWADMLSQMGFHHIYRVPRNDELINTMLEKYSEWWEKYIIGKHVPEPMNIDDIKRMCPAVSGTIVIDNEQLLGYIEEYREISAEIKPTGNMGKRKDQLKVLFLDGCRTMGKVIDDESADKWIFRDTRGHKLGSYGKTAKGNWSFR